MFSSIGWLIFIDKIKNSSISFRTMPAMLVFLAAIFLTLVVPPVVIPILTFFLIIRKVVEFGARIFKKSEFLEIVDPFSAMFATRPVYSRKSFTTVNILEIDRPTIPLHKLIADFEEKVLHAVQDASASRVLYPELKCKLVKWWGYYFWETCETFNLASQIKYLEDQDFPKVNLANTENWNKLVNYVSTERLWQEGDPVWEMLVMEKVTTERGVDKSLIIWRCSHVLCDGWSMLKMAARLFDTAVIPPAQQIPTQRPSYWPGIISLCTLPYDFVKHQLHVESVRALIPPPRQTDSTSCSQQDEIFSKTVPTLAIADLKRIKDTYQVDFLSLLLAGVTSAIREAYRSNSGHVTDAQIKVGFVLAVPNHPEKLCNHLSTGTILLPIGVESSADRLRFIGDRIRALRSTRLPQLRVYLLRAVGSLPITILNLVGKNSRPRASVVFNNVIGPQEKLHLYGNDVTVPYVGVNMAGNVNTGFAHDACFFTHGGAGTLRVSGFGDYFHRPDQDAGKFLDSCNHEWNKLFDTVDRNALSPLVQD